MNNPIDVASLPLMKLSFVFAVYQRQWKGFLPYFVSALWKQTFDMQWFCPFVIGPARGNIRAQLLISCLSWCLQGCKKYSLYNATLKFKDKPITCICVRHSQTFCQVSLLAAMLLPAEPRQLENFAAKVFARIICGLDRWWQHCSSQ